MVPDATVSFLITLGEIWMVLKRKMVAVEMKFSFLNLSIATIFYAEVGANRRAAVICGGGGWVGLERVDVEGQGYSLTIIL